MRWVALFVLCAFVASAHAAAPAKSKAQVERESAWKNRLTEKNMETGKPLHDFIFLDLQMGCTKADAEAVMKAGSHKATLVKGPERSSEVGETLVYEGNHKLARAKTTELSFFDDRLMRVVVVFETENLDITFPAVLEGIETKYGSFTKDPKEPKEAKDSKEGKEGKVAKEPPPKPPPPPVVRNLSREIGGLTLSLKTQKGAKGDEVVVTVQDPDLLDKQRDTRIEKERIAIGEF